MDLYKLPKDMLVEMVCEIRKDVEKEWREKLRKMEIKLEKAELVGEINYTHCGVLDCENYYAYNTVRHEDYFCYCDYCDREYCEDHQEWCESCDTWYCEYCYHEKHFIFCEDCKEFGCPAIHKMKCDSCDIITEICKANSVICMNCK